MVLPGWLAATTTVPMPVVVSVEPETVAGPERTLKATERPELAVAESAMGPEA